MVVSEYSNNHDNDDNDDNGSIIVSSSSLERALSDIEIVRSAYPDETSLSIPTGNTTTTTGNSANIDDTLRHENDNNNNTDDVYTEPSFPLHVTLYLSKQVPIAYIVLEYKDGYPTDTPLQISMYRDNTPGNHQHRIEHTVRTVRNIAQECFEDSIEAGLACCSVALETWNTYQHVTGDTDTIEIMPSSNLPVLSQHSDDIIDRKTTIQSIRQYKWYTCNESQVQDRKSIFIGHCCTIHKESDVSLAIQQLIQSNNKLQRATHQMYAYRLTEEKIVHDRKDRTITSTLNIIKYDHNDDGEDGAGIRIQQLLQLRNEMNVLVVVTRWFGGIHLGTKRFAHIINVAQITLNEFHNIYDTK